MAFERCTDTWEDVAGVTLREYATATKVGAEAPDRLWPTMRARRAVTVTVAGMTVAVLLVVMQPWRASDSYDTGVGEQRTVLLKDGTRVSLNTSSRVRVELASAKRTVRVEEGEALFEVAKDPLRPFVVQVGDREVVALGTIFSVRLGTTGEISGVLAVTLIEGQVSVRSASRTSDKAEETRPVLLTPGDRLRLNEPGGRATEGSQRVVMQMDRPHVDQLIAWRRGEAVFDDVPLSDAVAEMNRYSRQPIVLVGDDSSKVLRISGLFRTGDNAAFARAVAALHGLVVRDRKDRVELAPGSGG